MRDDQGEGCVKKCQKLRDVIYGRPLMTFNFDQILYSIRYGFSIYSYTKGRHGTQHGKHLRYQSGDWDRGPRL
jgi:hypothetical protein